MFHANDILLQSNSFDGNSIKNKFSTLICNIIDQLKAEHLDRLIHSSIKYVPNESKIDVIDGIIKGRCHSLKILPKLSKTEQFYILANINLDLIIPQLEETAPAFSSLVYSIVREMIIS